VLADVRPILLVPYQWIGDFVRCHSVVKICKERWPDRPVDVLTSTLCAPLLDYMPGVRKGVVWDLPRRRLAFGEQRRLAARLREENYGTALIMSRKWKAALAPALAGIAERVGFVGELRYGLLTDARSGEKKLQRMIDRCAILALPRNAKLPERWPLPELVVPKQEISNLVMRRGLAGEKRPVVVLCPGAVGPGKRWPESRYAELARLLKINGVSVWVVGGPGEKAIADEISAGGKYARDLTGVDLRDGILAIAAADAAVSNDSGLLHVAAGIGTPVVGLFGPTSPWHDGPLNKIAAVVEAPWRGAEGDFRGRTTEDIPVGQVLAAVRQALKRG
jgi:heptosyltransferase-2